AEKRHHVGLACRSKLRVLARHAQLDQKVFAGLLACLKSIPALQQIRLAQQASRGRGEAREEKVLGYPARLRRRQRMAGLDPVFRAEVFQVEPYLAVAYAIDEMLRGI